MRYLCLVACLFLLPLPAAAQHSFTLPPVGGPLPAIGPSARSWNPPRTPSWERPRTPSWERPHTPWWERPQVPWWESNRTPSWEQGQVGQPDRKPIARRSRGRQPQVVYIYQPYPVEVQPQVVVVERPVERIVEVEVPVREVVVESAAPEPEPPFVPSGDRTIYVIPGCYVGNVPPATVKLPASCDLSKLTTFTP